MSIGISIPEDYDEWKDRVLIMYEQRQRDNAYYQMHRGDSRGQEANRRTEANYRHQPQRRWHDKFLVERQCSRM